MRYHRSYMVLPVIGLMLLAGCGSAAPAYYTSEKDVTLESIQSRMTVNEILDSAGGISIETVDQSADSEVNESRTINTVYVKDGETYYFSQNTLTSDGSYMDVYCSGDTEDPYVYIAADGSADRSEITDTQLNKIFYSPMYTFDENYQLTEVTKEKGLYMAHVEYQGEDSSESSRRTVYDITIDPATGYFLMMQATFYGEGEGYPWTRTSVFNYSDTVTVNDIAKQTVNGTGEKAEKSEMKISFETVDIQGNAVTDEILRDAKVVLVNFWEPWCGPCVGEMPDLQKLYEKYKDQGLLILGIYATTGQDEDAQAIVEDAGITYPILKKGNNLYAFDPEYVPTTYFADSEGNLLNDEPVIGSQNYDAWEAMILDYLQ